MPISYPQIAAGLGGAAREIAATFQLSPAMLGFRSAGLGSSLCLSGYHFAFLVISMAARKNAPRQAASAEPVYALAVVLSRMLIFLGSRSRCSRAAGC